MSEFEVHKALVIDQPWISLILGGQKDWEMRSSSTAHRGWFGLIWKNMGSIYGVARLVDVGSPLSPDEMIDTYEHHRIPEDMIRSGAVAKWNTPWKLADVIRLPKPVRYKHPNGAVIWVNLDNSVSSAIKDQFLKLQAETPNLVSTQEQTKTSSESLHEVWRIIGETFLTQGNINHNHFYLADFFGKFPEDAVGGSNKASRAKRDIRVIWNGGPVVVTDLDGTKKIFRARSWIRDFFAYNGAVAGDKVIVEIGRPYEYRVRCMKDN